MITNRVLLPLSSLTLHFSVGALWKLHISIINTNQPSSGVYHLLSLTRTKHNLLLKHDISTQ